MLQEKMLLQQGDLEVGIMDFVLIFLIFLLFFLAFFGDLILIFEWKLWPPQIDFFLEKSIQKY